MFKPYYFTFKHFVHIEWIVLETSLTLIFFLLLVSLRFYFDPLYFFFASTLLNSFSLFLSSSPRAEYNSSRRPNAEHVEHQKFRVSREPNEFLRSQTPTDVRKLFLNQEPVLGITFPFLFHPKLCFMTVLADRLSMYLCLYDNNSDGVCVRIKYLHVFRWGKIRISCSERNSCECVSEFYFLHISQKNLRHRFFKSKRARDSTLYDAIDVWGS